MRKCHIRIVLYSSVLTDQLFGQVVGVNHHVSLFALAQYNIFTLFYSSFLFGVISQKALPHHTQEQTTPCVYQGVHYFAFHQM